MKDTVSLFKAVNWVQVGAAVFAALFSHSMAVRLGNGTLTASANGAPVHLTPDAIVGAAIMAFAGQPASIQIGSILVTFTPNTAAATAAPAA